VLGSDARGVARYYDLARGRFSTSFFGGQVRLWAPLGGQCCNIPDRSCWKNLSTSVPATGSRTPLAEAVKFYPDAMVLNSHTKNLIIAGGSAHLFLQVLTTNGHRVLVEKWVSGPLSPHISTCRLRSEVDPAALLNSIESRYTGQGSVPREGHETGGVGPWPETPEVDIIIRTSAKIDKIKAEYHKAMDELGNLRAAHEAHEAQRRRMEARTTSLQNRLDAVKNQRNQLSAELVLAREQLKNVWSRAAHAEAEVRQLREYIRINAPRETIPDNFGTLPLDGGNAGSAGTESSRSSTIASTQMQTMAKTTYVQNGR
jgi:hypothetical protein